MNSSLTFSAVLLAGGRSVRMGGDKAQLQVKGRELWKRQWALLDEFEVEQKILSARPDQSWVPAGIQVVHDSIVDGGPLAGIAAAMARASSTHLIVLAVDLPQMQAEWFETLRENCAPGIGAVGTRNGYCEPLAAIYPCSLSTAAEQALSSEERSLQRFIAQSGSAMKLHEITTQQVRFFANWNEPSDL